MAASTLTRFAARLPYRLITRLPAPVAVPALAFRNRRRNDTADHLSQAIDDRLRVDAYWLRFGRTVGPALSVYFDGEELLRIDGLIGQPHLHYCLSESRVRRGRGRVELPDSEPSVVLDRMIFELEHNLGYSLHLHRRRAVQRHAIDQARLSEIATSMRAHLIDVMDHHREEREMTARSDTGVAT